VINLIIKRGHGATTVAFALPLISHRHLSIKLINRASISRERVCVNTLDRVMLLIIIFCSITQTLEEHRRRTPAAAKRGHLRSRFNCSAGIVAQLPTLQNSRASSRFFIQKYCYTRTPNSPLTFY